MWGSALREGHCWIEVPSRQAGEFSEYPLPSPNGTACAPGNPTGGWGRPALALGYGQHAACTHFVAGGSRSDSPSARCIPSRAAGMGSERRNTGQPAAGVEAALRDRTLRAPSRALAAGWLDRRVGGGLGGIPAFQMRASGRRPSPQRSAGVAREGPCVRRERPSSGHPPPKGRLQPPSPSWESDPLVGTPGAPMLRRPSPTSPRRLTGRGNGATPYVGTSRQH